MCAPQDLVIGAQLCGIMGYKRGECFFGGVLGCTGPFSSLHLDPYDDADDDGDDLDEYDDNDLSLIHI